MPHMIGEIPTILSAIDVDVRRDKIALLAPKNPGQVPGCENFNRHSSIDSNILLGHFCIKVFFIVGQNGLQINFRGSVI